MKKPDWMIERDEGREVERPTRRMRLAIRILSAQQLPRVKEGSNEVTDPYCEVEVMAPGSLVILTHQGLINRVVSEDGERGGGGGKGEGDERNSAFRLESWGRRGSVDEEAIKLNGGMDGGRRGSCDSDGMMGETIRARTHAIHNNGYSPVWDECFNFSLWHDDLIFIR